MDRDAYLGDHDVRDFLAWAEPLVTGDRRIDHRPAADGPSFKEMFDAYEGYKWKFSVVLPGDKDLSEGISYKDSVRVLAKLRRQLQGSEEQADSDGFRAAAKAVLKWGGMGGNNEAWLDKIGDEVIPRLASNARLLDPATTNLDRASVADPMNSGFSKIYSLRVDGLPIYDSRVACASASLVRWFCVDKRLEAVPETLTLGVPPDRANVDRNPSCRHFKFPTIYYPGTKLYAQSNVKAAWLLGKLAKHPPFSAERDPLHALQSAMFMIGYAPLARPCQ